MYSKMAGAGIRSLAKFRVQMLRIATTGITLWQTALKWTAIAKFRAQVAAVKSSLWQSVLKFLLLSVAIRATVILFLAMRVLNAADCHNPRHTVHLSAELGKRLNSSSRHFTSRVPLFEASYLFAARLLEYKIPTRRIV
jgi:hypothetical protein